MSHEHSSSSPVTMAVFDPWRHRAALLLMLASGFAGLSYQIVWTQQCALWLGHESAAMLAVVTAFFGGLGAGALLLGPRIQRSAQPVLWYAGCELVIALWSIVLAFTMARFSSALLGMAGVQPGAIWQWSVAFFGTFFLLLPATAAMGATLPAMERITAQLRTAGQSIAGLYASNTLGAVVGVLAAAFWLIPALGLQRTVSMSVALNVVCSVSALGLFPRRSPASAQTMTLDPSAVRALLSRLALTGLLGIGYEVLVVRVLSQVAEDTVYTFAMLLAVYLVGSSLGAAMYQRWLAKRSALRELDDVLLCALACACLLGTASLWAAESLKVSALHTLGASMSAALVAEAFLALTAFGLPTLVMGALFSHLSARASESGVSFGRALGANTLGAAAAPLLFGVLALPMLEPKLALLLVAVGYLVLTTRRKWLAPSVWVPAGACFGIALLAPRLAFVDVPEGGRIVSYRDGVTAAVSVVEDADGVARLRINNRQQEGTSATLRVDGRQAWLPLLLHPAPKRVLFLGLGTGVTASAAAQDPTLQVDAVELLPEVIEASQHFQRVFASDAPNPRLRVVAADARRYVRTSTTSYDVIISDNFHPARSGSGSLYTIEHFDAVRQRLEAGGVFCQWLPLHQLDIETLRSIVQSFRAVFPQGWAMLASNSLETPVVGLIGRRDDARFEPSALREHIARAVRLGRLRSFGIEDELALLGSFIAGPQALEHFAANARANTDDHPIVAYLAPRATYAPRSSPRERLFELLRGLAIVPAELVQPTTDEAWQQRLAAYWMARNRFIESGRDVRPSSNVEVMLAQVRAPLLDVLRISPDFRPAYDPLFMMATALAQTNVSGARELLTELTQMQPARPEAAMALRQIGGSP